MDSINLVAPRAKGQCSLSTWSTWERPLHQRQVRVNIGLPEVPWGTPLPWACHHSSSCPCAWCSVQWKYVRVSWLVSKTPWKCSLLQDCHAGVGTVGFALWGMDWTWSIEPGRVNVSCPLSWNFLSTQGPIHSVDYCRRWSGTGSEFVAGPKKRGGKPRRTPMEGRTSCQWLVCYMCDPETGRILHTSMMLEPEGNETVLEALEDSLWPYPSAIASCMVKPVQWWSPPNKSLRWPSWSTALSTVSTHIAIVRSVNVILAA